MQYAKHNFRRDVVAFNGKEVLQAGYSDIMISEEENFPLWCLKTGFTPCTRKEFEEVYLEQSLKINEFIKEA